MQETVGQVWHAISTGIRERKTAKYRVTHVGNPAEITTFGSRTNFSKDCRCTLVSNA